MAAHKRLHLSVVSQEKKLLEEDVLSVTAPSTNGQITVLPSHIPLLTKLETGELRYETDQGTFSFVVSKGFLDKAPDNTLTVIVDTAVHQRDISEQKAQQAIAQARETLARSEDQRELLLAEASLKQAMWELQLAKKTRKSNI